MRPRHEDDSVVFVVVAAAVVVVFLDPAGSCSTVEASLDDESTW